jgi:hypothetical protein
MVEEFERVEEREEEEEVKDVCPLLSIAFKVLYPCLKAQCKWWMGRNCAIEALADITTMVEVLEGW